MSAKIGSLNVNLDLETARFKKGASEAEGRFSKMQSTFAGIATKVAAATAGIGLIAGQIASRFTDLSDRAVEMDNAARLAGTGFEEFQRKAGAAKSVGIGFEKLGDIFKDTQDKIGDFLATGGGEMADFFENIAPKVGVTAEQFRKLSGPDALQLYYNSLEKAGLSQSEMTFYMESIADEATGLIPLLQKNGAEFDKLGNKTSIIDEKQLEKLRSYKDSMARLEGVMQDVTLTLVDAGLLDAFGELAEKLGAVVGGFNGVEAAADATDEELKRTEGARSFGESLRETSDWLQDLVDDFDAFNASNRRAVLQTRENVEDNFARMGEAFDRWGSTAKEWAIGIPDALSNMASTAKAAVDRMVSDIASAITGRLSAIWERAKARVEEVRETFFNLWDKVTRRSYVPDMVDDIQREMARLDAVMVEPAARAASKTEQTFLDLQTRVAAILNDLYPEEARLRQIALNRDDIAASRKQVANDNTLSEEERQRRLGVLDDADYRLRRRRWNAPEEGVKGSFPVRDMDPGPIATVDLEKTQEAMRPAIEATERWRDLLGTIGTTFGGAAANIAGAVAAVINPAIQSSIGKVGQLQMAMQGITSLFQSIFGKKWGGIIGGLFQVGTAFFGGGKIPGFADGTPSAPRGLALVGKRGPELVNFRGGERVWNNRDSMAMGRGGKLEVEVIANNDGFAAMVRDQAGRVVAASAPHLVNAAASSAVGTMIRSSKRGMTPGGLTG